MSAKFATADISVSDPRQAIVETAAQHMGEYDSLIVLAYLPDNELSNWPHRRRKRMRLWVGRRGSRWFRVGSGADIAGVGD